MNKKESIIETLERDTAMRNMENMYGHSLEDTKQKAMAKFNGMGNFSR